MWRTSYFFWFCCYDFELFCSSCWPAAQPRYWPNFPLPPPPHLSLSLYRLHCTKEGLRIEWVGGRKSVELCYNTEAETVKETASREKEEGFCILKCHPDPDNCQPVTCQDFLKHGTERGGEEKKGSNRRQTQLVEIFRKERRGNWYWTVNALLD